MLTKMHSEANLNMHNSQQNSFALDAMMSVEQEESIHAQLIVGDLAKMRDESNGAVTTHGKVHVRKQLRATDNHITTVSAYSV